MRSLLLMVALAVLVTLAALTMWSFPEEADGQNSAPPAAETVHSDSTPGPGNELPVLPAESADPEPSALDPDPNPVWALAPSLAQAAEQAMASFTGAYSVAVVDLTSGESWSLNPDERYHPASTIKVPVTLYALDQYIAGNLGWHDLITYLEQDFESPGGGAFETAPFGGRYPVENLVNRALMYSNNVAVNMLGRHLGWNEIRAFTRSIDGELYRLPDGTPEVTVMSEVGWWLHLHRLAKTHPDEAQKIIGPLSEVAYTGRIGAGLPDGVAYLHKFGSYNGHFHDGGIVYAERPYILVIMTRGAQGGEWEADLAIAELTAAIHGVIGGSPKPVESVAR